MVSILASNTFPLRIGNRSRTVYHGGAGLASDLRFMPFDGRTGSDTMANQKRVCQSQVHSKYSLRQPQLSWSRWRMCTFCLWFFFWGGVHVGVLKKRLCLHVCAVLCAPGTSGTAGKADFGHPVGGFQQIPWRQHSTIWASPTPCTDFSSEGEGGRPPGASVPRLSSGGLPEEGGVSSNTPPAPSTLPP